MRIAFDTNVLAYAEGVNGAIMRDQALKLIQRLPPDAVVLPAQTPGRTLQCAGSKSQVPPTNYFLVALHALRPENHSVAA